MSDSGSPRLPHRVIKGNKNSSESKAESLGDSSGRVIITAEMERELFKRFWTWLVFLGAAIIATVGATSAFVSHYLTQIAAASARNTGIEVTQPRLDEIARRLADSQNQASDIQKQSIVLMASLSKFQGSTEEIVRNITLKAQEVDENLKRIQAVSNGVANFSSIERVASELSRNEDFVRSASIAINRSLTGVIVAFESPQCPAGWNRYDAAVGRVIVGAGQGPGLRIRPSGSVGGSESFQLTNGNMPAHQHDTQLGTLAPIWGAGPARGGIIAGTSMGTFQSALTSVHGNQNPEPIPLMPPFIALSVCRKE